MSRTVATRGTQGKNRSAIATSRRPELAGSVSRSLSHGVRSARSVLLRVLFLLSAACMPHARSSRISLHSLALCGDKLLRNVVLCPLVGPMDCCSSFRRHLQHSPSHSLQILVHSEPSTLAYVHFLRVRSLSLDKFMRLTVTLPLCEHVAIELSDAIAPKAP